MTALLDAMDDPAYPAAPVLVIANRGDAGGLQAAEARGVATGVVDHTAYPDRERFEIEIHARLVSASVDVVCLAGFMRVLSPWFVERWAGKLINIHPSLLPLFAGLHTHKRALEAGVRVHGCTVHHVTSGVDEGPIIGQAAVPVLDGDTVEDLSARVLAVEHALYPACLAKVARSLTPNAPPDAPAAAPTPQTSPAEAHLISL